MSMLRFCRQFAPASVGVAQLLALVAGLATDATAQPDPSAADGHFVREHWVEFGIEHANPMTNRRFRVNAPEVVLHPEFGSRSEVKSSGCLQLLMPEVPRLLTGTELYLELWGGHPGTANRRVTINGRTTYEIADHGGLTHCTYQYPRISLKRTDVVEGYNALQFAVDQGKTFWGHMIVDNACLRAILADDHPDLKRLGLVGFVAAVKATDIGGERIHLSPALPPSSRTQIASVEYHGFYDGYDENGNEHSRDWHGFTKSRQPQAILGTTTEPPFELDWATSMLPDQPDVAVKAIVRLKQAPNLCYQTRPLTGVKLPLRRNHVRLYSAKQMPEPFWSRASRTKTCKIALDADPAQIERAELHVVVWDGGKGNVQNYFTLNGHPLEVAGSGKHDLLYTTTPVDPKWLKAGDNEIELLSDTEHHGIEICLPGPALMVRMKAAADRAAVSSSSAAVAVSEKTLFGDMDCFRVQTPTATYLYGKRGAGLASILDKSGNDWISYHHGDKALGEYRGLPKCGQPTKFFHCGYGFGQYKNDNEFVSRVTMEEPGHVRIESETVDKKTAGSWDFYPTHATFTLERIDLPTFWFLYEGTPGGKLDSARDFVIRPDGQKITLDQPWSQIVPWACFGASESSAGLLLVNHQSPEPGQTDSYVSWPFEKDASGSFRDMTVFGFGRKGYKELIKHIPDLKRLPARFSIAMIEQADHPSAKSSYETIVAATNSQQAATQRAFEQHALTQAGDPARGRELFFNESLAKCIICHKMDEKGGEAGPDLSVIGGKFARPHLIESLLEPSRQIVEGYRTSAIATKDGRAIAGIIKAESDQSLTLVNVEGKKLSIPVAEIDERQESDVSLMPSGLEKSLTPEQFTDLVAFLESRRPQGKGTPGSSIAGAITLPARFEVSTVATGITGCTALETTSDDRVFICEQTGTLRVVKHGKLLAQPALRLNVDSYWERGLIGVTVDPDFPRTPFVYVCYVAPQPYPHHRISRFTMRGDVADPASEKLLLEGDDQTKLGGKVPAGHQGGALHFGVDGKLYIAIGEQTAGKPSQDLDTFQGKLLRINADGSIPQDNPFLAQTQGKYQAIWARGLRNPFTFAIRRPGGEMCINDIGGDKFEEVNRGAAGGNYGWPLNEGPTDDSRYRGPIHWYPHASVCGADFAAENSPWPAEYRGQYFFAEYIHGWIKTLDVTNPANVQTFATGLRNPVDLRFARDGSLYVLLRNAWVIDGKFQSGTGSLLRITQSAPSKSQN